jgi:hypothetical protein
MRKIKMRLGGEPSGRWAPPAKPRGMWFNTYLRLCQSATKAQMTADRAFIAAFERRFGPL